MYITKINQVEQVTLVTFENFPSQITYLKKLFSLLGEQDINVDMISQTAPKGNTVTIGFTMNDADITKLLIAIAPMQSEFDIKPFIVSNNVKLSLYGQDLPKYSGVCSIIFSTLADADIDVKLISTGDVDISVLISEENTKAAITALEKAFY